MDFINKLPRPSCGHDSIWVIVDRLTKSAHFLAIREDYKMESFTRLYINEIVARHRCLCQSNLIMTTDGQSECTMETLEDMLRACAVDFAGPFEVVERVGPGAYRLRLPQELVDIHDIFPVSNLKKCLVDVNLNVPLKDVKIDDKLHFVEEHKEIMDCEVKKLKKSRILIVKVRWNPR
ncbi:putative reverse transcriptase domain-containing protein [Tanacetum coccineum]